ncbi:unnamed protein product [Fraxinus pennsylvanica]|uniref:TF-B3 domain-containing protein n=1 Tax=Fraxinus pennsylvanica TaxID=56036 RepID=A0AAD2AE47_9LAMI|nr:unnamed protein product [Fraxinus pennsylvanica]
MVQTDEDGARKDDDAERNEDLYYTEPENDSEEDIHDSDDNAQVYMEIEEDKNEDAEDENGEDDEGRAEQVANGKRPLDPYGNDIFNSGLAIRPRNPYVVTKIRKLRPNDLYIPKETIVDFQLDNLPEEMSLIDPQDRQFQVKLIRWKDDRVWYRGGWKSLCAVNFVSAEDTCICEFVGGRLRVEVVRRNN